MLALLCSSNVSAGNQYKTKNIIIVTIDGARYSESIGAQNANMPYLWDSLRSKGSLVTEFYNEGYTLTIPGHTSIVTGVWQWIDNEGKQHPAFPTVFEYYRQYRNAPDSSCYVIAGKKKIGMVAFSNHAQYGERFGARFSVSDDPVDIPTYDRAIEILRKSHPQVTLLQFAGVDRGGHSKTFSQYLASIRQADSLVFALWKFLQNDPIYRGTTMMIVTNDHGRHLDNVESGFDYHGDGCEGCRRIFLFVTGPDILQGLQSHQRRTMIDVVPLIGTVLGIPVQYVRGDLMREVLTTSCDLDYDGTVSTSDVTVLQRFIGVSKSDKRYLTIYDLNADAQIDSVDLQIFKSSFPNLFSRVR